MYRLGVIRLIYDLIPTSRCSHKSHSLLGVRTRAASTDLKFHPSPPPQNAGELKEMNLVQTIAHTIDLAMSRDSTAIVFGEDVAFGGVFRLF